MGGGTPSLQPLSCVYSWGMNQVGTVHHLAPMNAGVNDIILLEDQLSSAQGVCPLYFQVTFQDFVFVAR